MRVAIQPVSVSAAALLPREEGGTVTVTYASTDATAVDDNATETFGGASGDNDSDEHDNEENEETKQVTFAVAGAAHVNVDVASCVELAALTSSDADDGGPDIDIGIGSSVDDASGAGCASVGEDSGDGDDDDRAGCACCGGEEGCGGRLLHSLFARERKRES